METVEIKRNALEELLKIDQYLPIFTKAPATDTRYLQRNLGAHLAVEKHPRCNLLSGCMYRHRDLLIYNLRSQWINGDSQ